jgi:hypothetical protein
LPAEHTVKEWQNIFAPKHPWGTLSIKARRSSGSNKNAPTDFDGLELSSRHLGVDVYRANSRLNDQLLDREKELLLDGAASPFVWSRSAIYAPNVVDMNIRGLRKFEKPASAYPV